MLNFIKPNKRKIIIFLILVISTLFMPITGWFTPESIYEVIVSIKYGLDDGSFIDEGGFIYVIFFVLIPWMMFYYISCALAYSYDKFKKEKLGKRGKIILSIVIISVVIAVYCLFMQYFS